MWTKVKDGQWRAGETPKGVTGFKSYEEDSQVVIEALRRLPSSIDEVDLSFTTIDADMMSELGRFKALTSLRVDACNGALLPLPPSLIKLHWWCGDGMELRDLLPAVAQSGIVELWLKRHPSLDHALIAAAIETSKLKCVTLSNTYYMHDHEVARYVVAAERCDIERIQFWRQTMPPNVDLRRTRKLIEFGCSDYIDNNGSRGIHYTSQLKSAFTVRRVLAVLSARSGPAAKFLKRDGDHACLSRIYKYM